MSKTAKLTIEQQNDFGKAKHCYLCNCEFTNEVTKIREHNHFNNDYRGASCQSCNTQEGKSSKLIPVFFHNGSRYDFHFIIEELMKYENKFNKVSILPKTAEEYISIEYGSYYRKLRFLDSYRFMTKSLDEIVNSLKPEDLKITKHYFSNEKQFNLIRNKGIFPYEWFNRLDKLKETELPSIDEFYSTLKQKGITKKEYSRAKEIWDEFNCKSFEDYHDIYLKADVFLLADSFERFRDFFIEHHKIDPSYCFSSPGLTWECGLKYTGVELELLTDYDMLMMVEKGIRGGFSGVLGNRYVRTNNKYMEDFDNMKESNYLLYLDANNLYGYAMSKPLPTKDFKWEEDLEYYKHIPKGRGCVIDCDLEYTSEGRIGTNKFPLAPEKLKIFENDLNPNYQGKILEIEDKKIGKTEKLILNLKDKENYVLHYKILEFYESLGLKVKKVHRIISFKQSPWLKEYIDFNTNQRTKANTNFEKDLWKLMNNAFFGKTMENIRNRISFELFSDEHKAKKQFSKPTFKDRIIFNENLVGILKRIPSIRFNKPIYLGLAILDYSKLLMYEFYYNTINKIFPYNEIIGFDTDSYFLNIYTDDVYKDLEQIKDDLDTSDYPQEHPLYSTENKKIIGKFKDELNGKIMTDLVFLRSKAYAYKVNNEDKKKLKGITKTTVSNISFDDYKNCLFQTPDKYKVRYDKMHVLNSDKHKMKIFEVNKKSLSPYDDKRYILNDGIRTIPHTDPVTSALLELLSNF